MELVRHFIYALSAL